MSICRNCGKDTSWKPSNRRSFCNSGCFNQWQRESGYNSKKERRRCLECGSEFTVIPSSSKKFCGSSCGASFSNRRRKLPESSKLSKSHKLKRAYREGKLSGLKKGAIRAKKDKAVLTCLSCKKKFEVYPFKKEVRKYCSRACSYADANRTGGYHPGSVRNYKSGWYKSSVAGDVWLDSSYEFVMARYLDSKGYKWIKNTQGFPYRDKDGKQRQYIPDFYIEDQDLWVETKGYTTKNDELKLAHFPHRIALVGKKEIYEPEKWGF